MSWESIKVADAIEAPPRVAGHQILASEIAPSGRFPVVDQGKAPIAGYTDMEDRVISDGLPFVVFGDHTRCVKYVDFPFVVGADGTKLLKPDPESFDPKFFYYALRHARVPSRGYNRHFTLLKEISLPRPPLDAQREIAAALTVIEDALRRHAQLYEAVTTLKRSLLAAGFSTGFRRAPLVNSELGLVPEGWRVARVDEVADLRSGGTPSRKRPEFWRGGSIPWVRTAEVDNCTISATGEHITPEGLANSSAKLFPPGTLLMAMYGQGVTRAKVALLEIEAATNQACVAFFPKGALSSEYLYYLFQSRYEDLRQHGHGANQKNLSAEIIKGLTIAFPRDLDEQAESLRILRSVDERIQIAVATRSVLAEIFETTLDGLMAGRIGVDSLADVAYA